MKRPKHVYEIEIRATPAQIWNAITNGERTRLWLREMRVESDWMPGSSVRYIGADGEAVLTGTVLVFDPPRRLVTTFNGPRAKFGHDAPSRVTWELIADDPVTRLRLVHDDFDGETDTYRAVAQGWPVHLAALTSLLAAGEPLQNAA